MSIKLKKILLIVALVISIVISVVFVLAKEYNAALGFLFFSLFLFLNIFVKKSKEDKTSN